MSICCSNFLQSSTQIDVHQCHTVHTLMISLPVTFLLMTCAVDQGSIGVVCTLEMSLVGETPRVLPHPFCVKSGTKPHWQLMRGFGHAGLTLS
jgi:hypothetical protein